MSGGADGVVHVWDENLGNKGTPITVGKVPLCMACTSHSLVRSRYFKGSNVYLAHFRRRYSGVLVFCSRLRRPHRSPCVTRGFLEQIGTGSDAIKAVTVNRTESNMAVGTSSGMVAEVIVSAFASLMSFHTPDMRARPLLRRGVGFVTRRCLARPLPCGPESPKRSPCKDR